MELASLNSWCQDIKALYHDVYQLCRLPGQSRCKEQMAEWLHKEILDSIKECLRLQWPPTHQARQQMQLPANNPRPDPHTAFAATNQRAYEEMMALARDAQQWAVATAVILEEQMERMGHPIDCQCSTSCWHSASCRRSRSLGCQEESPQVTPHCRETEARPESSQVTSHYWGTGDINLYKYQKMSWVTSCWRGTAQEQTQSPSSTRQKCRVKFTEGRVLVPELLGESLKHGVRECQCDAETQAGYELLPLSWQEGWQMTEATPWEMADQARQGEAQTTPVEEEDVHLECLPQLKPHLQQLLDEEKPTLAAPMWETTSCCHHQCHHYHHHCHLLKIQSPPPCMLLIG